MDVNFLEMTSLLPVLSASFVNTRFLNETQDISHAIDEPPFLDTVQCDFHIESRSFVSHVWFSMKIFFALVVVFMGTCNKLILQTQWTLSHAISAVGFIGYRPGNALPHCWRLCFLGSWARAGWDVSDKLTGWDSLRCLAVHRIWWWSSRPDDVQSGLRRIHVPMHECVCAFGATDCWQDLHQLWISHAKTSPNGRWALLKI